MSQNRFSSNAVNPVEKYFPQENGTLRINGLKNPVRKVNENPTPTLNNWKLHQFYELVQLLEDMSKLEADDDFAIGMEVKNRALIILSLIKESFEIDFPKLLPEGHECLSFTWEKNEVKNFLTIYNDEIENTVYSRKSGIRCVQSLGVGEGLDLNKLATALATKPRTLSADTC